MDLGSLEAPAATMNAHNCYIHITRKKDVDMLAFCVIDHSFGKYSSKCGTNLTIIAEFIKHSSRASRR